jgi:hypothetical protein
MGVPPEAEPGRTARFPGRPSPQASVAMTHQRPFLSQRWPKFCRGMAICIAIETVAESSPRRETARRMYPRPQWGLGAQSRFGALSLYGVVSSRVAGGQRLQNIGAYNDGRSGLSLLRFRNDCERIWFFTAIWPHKND